MTPWSGIMIRGLLLISAVITRFTVQAITVTIDRADVKTLQPHSSSMTLNGWRPLTTRYEEIGINVSPSSNLERNAAPLHPVLNKLQEHMAASERHKPQRKSKPHEYNPPSILGSFSVFGHAATKNRGEVNVETKHVPKETKEYSFLLPPPRDAFRFEVDSHKKPVVRDNEPFLRQPQYMSQMHKPDIRGPTYYVKTPNFSTTSHPVLATKNRAVINGYNVQQAFIPQRQPAKTFESLKVNNDNTNSNNRHYSQISKAEAVSTFGKEVSSDRNYNRYPPQNPITSGTGNFYSHAPNYKTTFERDPSYLIHESHEIGYVTPPYEYKFRQPVPYESILPHDLYSTNPPRLEANKYNQPANNNYRNEHAKPAEHKTKIAEKTVQPTYYIAEAHHDFIVPPQVWHMKQSFKSDINEVLPKVNHPTQFNQQSSNPNAPIHKPPQQSQKVTYVRPELQQQQQKQYQGSIIPININQRPTETEYETPESISLKHFNEQQFLLQQQLIEQDRRRLREQELQRQRVLEQQQLEELNKRQEEIKLLEQQQQLKSEQDDIKKETNHRPHYPEQVKNHKVPQHHRFSGGERERQKPETAAVIRKKEQEQNKPQPQHYEVPQFSTEPNFQFTDVAFSGQKGQQYEFTSPQNGNEFQTSHGEDIQEEHRGGQTDYRPQRPQKLSRDPIRRRKPSYENTPLTDKSTESPEIIDSFTDIPIQTTTWEIVSTTSVNEKIRTRKPAVNANTPRRRRPSTTTPEPRVTSINDNVEEFFKYDRPEVSDISKRRRVTNKPQANNYEISAVERKPVLRKRPGQKYPVNTNENYNVDITSEAVNPNEYHNRELENLEKYPNKYLNNDTYITEYTPTYSQVNPAEYQTEINTEYPVVGTEYSNVEGGKLTKFEYYEPTSHDNRGGHYSQHSEENLPLEHLFVKTEPSNYAETTTPTSLSTGFYSAVTPVRLTVKTSRIQDPSRATATLSTTTTTTTAEPPLSTTKAHHRIRPLRYGNATRPRFSVKEYKSRLDYKNKIIQATSSSTESSVRQRPINHRNNQHQTTGEPGYRETTGRYKYMSRVSYKTTSTTPVSYDPTNESGSSSTTERTNKFTPKRRMNANVYRSRFSNTSQIRPSKHENVESSSVTHSGSRPENVFSSMRRRVPHPNAKTTERSGEKKGIPSTEMTAEETSFYNQPTTTQFTESANEIAIDKESAQEIVDQNNNEDSSKVDGKQKLETLVSKDSAKSTESVSFQVNEDKDRDDQKSSNNEGQAATPFDIQFEEELFAKASQSVADLTSSASALYNKPGMFKAVGPENRVVKSTLQLTTEEPTLPIEAFFQELSKKID